MYNDCPLCNSGLTLYFPDQYAQLIKCKSCEFYSVAIFMNRLQEVLTSTLYNEYIWIKPYSIYRDKNGTYVYYKKDCLRLNYILPFDKFNSAEKIERLFLLS